MAGFRSLARQVRDPRGDMALRRYSLRKCLERFAPYGHRATWDHLCARHGIEPEDRAPDPGRLIRALEELEEARAVWLAYEAGFAERRRREKHDGLRRPGTFDDWHRRTWGGNGIAHCEDPGSIPAHPWVMSWDGSSPPWGRSRARPARSVRGPASSGARTWTANRGRGRSARGAGSWSPGPS